MQIVIVEKDGDTDIFVKCPHCLTGESHPIDEQRHHLQYFTVKEWLDDDNAILECNLCYLQFQADFSEVNK